MLGRGGGAGDGQDAHGVVVALPQGVVDVIGPVETPDVGDRGYQAKDGREDDLLKIRLLSDGKELAEHNMLVGFGQKMISVKSVNSIQ